MKTSIWVDVGTRDKLKHLSIVKGGSINSIIKDKFNKEFEAIDSAVREIDTAINNKDNKKGSNSNTTGDGKEHKDIREVIQYEKDYKETN